MTQYFATTPMFILFASLVLITLVALTMRAVVRRDRAMINTTLDEPHQAAYKQRWRNAA